MSRTWVGMVGGSGWIGLSIWSTSLDRLGDTMRGIDAIGTGLTAVGSIRIGLGIADGRAANMRTGRGMLDGNNRGAG